MKERDKNLSDEDRRIIRRRLALILLLGPLTLFLPRIVAAIVSPQRYVDSWSRLAVGILMPPGWPLLVWSALPYFVIGLAGLTFLQQAREPRGALRRRWALIASLVSRSG